MFIKNIFKRKERKQINFENGPVQRFIDGKKEEEKSNNLFDICYLDKKRELFRNWWIFNLKGKYPEDMKEFEIDEFIEYVAMWYEKKIPDYDVNNALIIGTKVSKNELINEYLIDKEKELLLEPSYPKYVTLSIKDGRESIRIYLTEEGIVKDIENDFTFNNSLIKKENLVGKDINQVLEILKRYHKARYDQIINIEACINEYKSKVVFKNMLIDSIMYRIIEKGNMNMGAKRAYIFAREFKRDKDIPISYGIDMNDPYLKYFIEVYLKDGGNPQISCFINYKKCVEEHRELDIESLEDVYKTITDDAYDLYRYLMEKEHNKDEIKKVKNLHE